MAEKSNYRFKGHETFVLREGWLHKGLSEVKKNPKVFSEHYGADALGVGPNMAKAIRYWLRAAGLVDDSSKSNVTLTEMGELIASYDPYMEDVFTPWLLHCRIVANEKQATAWNLFFNRFSYEEFDKNQMYREMKELVSELPGGERVSEKSIEGDCDAILHMYLPKKERESNPEEKNISPFGALGLLKNNGNSFERRQPDLNRLPEEIVWYLLAETKKGKTSVSLEDLLEQPGGPGKVLFLKRMALMELLDRLEAKGRITINRTAGLHMVYWERTWSGLEVAEEYYRNHRSV